MYFINKILQFSIFTSRQTFSTKPTKQHKKLSNFLFLNIIDQRVQCLAFGMFQWFQDIYLRYLDIIAPTCNITCQRIVISQKVDPYNRLNLKISEHWICHSCWLLIYLPPEKFKLFYWYLIFMKRYFQQTRNVSFSKL